jgi:hypothetical protein
MRLTGFKAKPLFFVALSAAMAAFAVSACGSSNSTITVASTGNGVGVYGVITTDSTAMPVIKRAEGTTSATILDGDQHKGNHVCGFNVSKNGHTYQFDWYTDNSLAAAALQTECGSAAQSAFLNEAP